MSNELKPVTLKPLRSGNSRNMRITVRDKATKAAIDITGDKFYFTVKEHIGQPDTEAVVQSSVVAPAGADATNGIVILPVTAADTMNVESNTYNYDIVWLKLVSAPGERDTVQEGEVSFSKAVTDAQS